MNPNGQVTVLICEFTHTGDSLGNIVYLYRAESSYINAIIGS